MIDDDSSGPDGFDPGGTLQVYPTRTAIYGSRERRMPLMSALDGKEMDPAGNELEPIGDLLGVLVSVDARWVVGTVVRLGPFSVTPTPEREYFVNCAPPAAWASAMSLEFRVFGLRSPLAPLHLPAKVPHDAVTCVGKQATKWLDSSPPPKASFADMSRGLQLEVTDASCTMRWFHRGEGYVFSEVGAKGFLRTIMVRHNHAVSETKGWKRAQDTRLSVKS